MQTIWHDSNGRVKAVYDGGTTSTVWDERGYTKALNDPSKNGRVSQDHVVTVENGEVVSATHDPIPPDPEKVQRQQDAQRARELREEILDMQAAGENVPKAKQIEFKRLKGL